MNWHNSKNELSYWYPSLVKSGVLTPRTEIVPIDCDLIYLLDGVKPEGYDALLDKMIFACKQIGMPSFIRTGMTSGKHFGYCFLESVDHLKQRIAQLTEWSYCADLLGLPLTEFCLRERLELETAFVAFQGLPINKERRYFFKDGQVICHHPYWIPYAIENEQNLPEDWEELLDKLNYESPEEIEFLTLQSEKVAANFEGAWSLDWAITKEGKWYAIDMAVAEESFHWDDCPNIPSVTNS